MGLGVGGGSVLECFINHDHSLGSCGTSVTVYGTCYLLLLKPRKQEMTWGWRDCCSFRRPEFSSQHPHQVAHNHLLDPPEQTAQGFTLHREQSLPAAQFSPYHCWSLIYFPEYRDCRIVPPHPICIVLGIEPYILGKHSTN